jgi:hypothetical protein
MYGPPRWPGCGEVTDNPTYEGSPLDNIVAATRRAYFFAITCTKAAIKNVTLMPPPMNWGIRGPRQPK